MKMIVIVVCLLNILIVPKISSFIIGMEVHKSHKKCFYKQLIIMFLYGCHLKWLPLKVAHFDYLYRSFILFADNNNYRLEFLWKVMVSCYLSYPV